MSKRNQTLREQIIAVLNRNLSPWTYNGSEPFCQELFAVVEGREVNLHPSDRRVQTERIEH